ncbi:MAG TPA: hypothetical protein VGP88_08435 [Thermoplasmata archaeon]|jgi:hypothetical protein|nr:hypothetical protein [Thermoplasmata archaeon]
MATDGSTSNAAASHQGVRRIEAGSVIGLAAGLVGIALPIGLVLLATYDPGLRLLTGKQLIETAAILAIAGALLFAISLLVFRLGFSRLRTFDRRFWSASILAMLGTVGMLLLIVPIAIAFASSDAISNCIAGAPSHALTCVRSVSPLASYWAIAAFWLLWLGGLGVVIGVGLAASRFHQVAFYGGAAVYAILLLGLLGPALGLLLPFVSLTYPLLAAPFLILLASALTFQGCRRALQRG